MKKRLFPVLALGLLSIFVVTTVQAEPQYFIFEGQVNSVLYDPSGIIAESGLEVGSEVTYTLLFDFEKDTVVTYYGGTTRIYLDYESDGRQWDYFYADYISGSGLTSPNDGDLTRLDFDIENYNYGLLLYEPAFDKGFEKVVIENRGNRIELLPFYHPGTPGFQIGDQFTLRSRASQTIADERQESLLQATVYLTQILTHLEESTTAIIDITPDTLNMKSNGNWVTAYIELPEGSSVYDIDPLSVGINKINNEEVANPLWTVGPSEVGDYDDDGVEDLMVKFDRQELIEFVAAGDVEITLAGELGNGTAFDGTDTIRVREEGYKQESSVGKGKSKKKK